MLESGCSCSVTCLMTPRASAICSLQCFSDCTLLVGKGGVLKLHMHGNLCRLHPPTGNPGNTFKMHTIRTAQTPVSILFPCVSSGSVALGAHPSHPPWPYSCSSTPSSQLSSSNFPLLHSHHPLPHIPSALMVPGTQCYSQLEVQVHRH